MLEYKIKVTEKEVWYLAIKADDESQAMLIAEDLYILDHYDRPEFDDTEIEVYLNDNQIIP